MMCPDTCGAVTANWYKQMFPNPARLATKTQHFGGPADYPDCRGRSLLLTLPGHRSFKKVG